MTYLMSWTGQIHRAANEKRAACGARFQRPPGTLTEAEATTYMEHAPGMRCGRCFPAR